ncbi:MAG: putative porin, partial [Bdellovibrio sp.]|nr:putative porin [Methylotenera sp.]
MKKLPQIKPVSIKPITLLIAAFCVAITQQHAVAGERESLEQLRATTNSLVNLLVQEGVLSKDKANNLLKQAAQDAEKAKAKDAAAPTAAGAMDAEIDKKMVRVQYVPDIVKNEMKEDIKKEVMKNLNYKAGTRLGMPEWIDRLAWEGSLRLRAEKDSFPA